MSDVFERHRPLLFALAYRMLGARADAEDVVQEAFLRWQSAPPDVASPKSYLTTITARLALDQLKSARRRREVYVGTWLPEPIVNEPSPFDKQAIAESLSLAFLHVLESLTPQERAAFLLREVFEADYSEVAGVLETSEANSRQLVTRAKRHLQERRPRFTVDRARHQEILGRFLQACAAGDKESLKSMLREDAVSYSDGGGKTYAAINPIFGADKVIRLIEGLRQKGVGGAWSGYFAEVNGEPGFVYTLDGKPQMVTTIDLDEAGRIRGIYGVLNPDKLPRKEQPHINTDKPEPEE